MYLYVFVLTYLNLSTAPLPSPLPDKLLSGFDDDSQLLEMVGIRGVGKYFFQGRDDKPGKCKSTGAGFIRIQPCH